MDEGGRRGEGRGGKGIKWMGEGVKGGKNPTGEEDGRG